MIDRIAGRLEFTGGLEVVELTLEWKVAVQPALRGETGGLSSSYTDVCVCLKPAVHINQAK